ncbi:serine/threonine-protein kinase PknH/PknJ, partial [Mycobacterium sp.]|uniref:serine/threonine-protein kinase PknH/PknJ n=1 Tax=Mycobacterium sp. TaxID=1785 RepID=UPI002B7B7C04
MASTDPMSGFGAGPGLGPATLSVGSVFAGYRVERVLGAGGTGTVYLVRDPDFPRNDALKVVGPELSRDGGFRARLVREADAAAALDHPNIVLIYRRGECDGQFWIAMRFVDGADAEAVLRAGAMAPARAVHIIGQVGKALDFAHQRGVVHGDIKPSNFLLSGPVGPDERVMLGDFGIARGLGDVGLTVTDSVLATICYAAPEVLAGGPVDHRADLYSLGGTLFRLLTGQPPFPADGLPALVAAHLQTPPPRVTERVPGFSERMDAVIATAMAKDPAQRFSSAGELAAAAAAALNDAAVSTTATGQPVPQIPTPPPGWHPPPGFPPPPGLPPPPGFRRRRRGRILAALAVLVLTAAAAITAVTLTARSHPPPSAPTASSASGPPTTTTPAGPVLPTGLTRLLLSANQVSAIVAVPDVRPTASVNYLLAGPYKISEQDCVGAWLPGTAQVYGGAGSTGVRSQVLSNASKDVASIIQAVIAFPSTDAAQKLVSDQVPQWSACANRTYTDQSSAGTESRWTFGPLSNTDGTLSMTHVAEALSMVR